MDAWPRAPLPHPLAALDSSHSPVLRSNPLYTEEEEQEIIIIVQDSTEEAGECEAAPPRAPRRVPSTSSGYGSGGSGSSQGRVTPSPPAPHIPKTPEDFVLERSHTRYPEPGEFPRELRLSDGDQEDSRLSGEVGKFKEGLKLNGECGFNRLRLKDEGFQGPPDTIVLRVTASDEECEGPLSRSLQEDIKSCLSARSEVELVVSAALEGAGGLAGARARLQAALLALAPVCGQDAHAPAAVPYCGPGVRPGDVTMMPKSSDMSLLAASALFTLDAAKGELLARRLARGRRRRRRCRAVVAVAILGLLMAAVGAAELLFSRGTSMFGLLLR